MGSRPLHHSREAVFCLKTEGAPSAHLFGNPKAASPLAAGSASFGACAVVSGSGGCPLGRWRREGGGLCIAKGQAFSEGGRRRMNIASKKWWAVKISRKFFS